MFVTAVACRPQVHRSPSCPSTLWKTNIKNSLVTLFAMCSVLIRLVLTNSDKPDHELAHMKEQNCDAIK